MVIDIPENLKQEEHDTPYLNYVLDGFEADRKFLSTKDAMNLISNKSVEPEKCVHIKTNGNEVFFIHVPEDINSDCVVKLIHGVYKDKSVLVGSVNTIDDYCTKYVTKHNDKRVLTRIFSDIKGYAYVETFHITQ